MTAVNVRQLGMAPTNCGQGHGVILIHLHVLAHVHRDSLGVCPRHRDLERAPWPQTTLALCYIHRCVLSRCAHEQREQRYCAKNPPRTHRCHAIAPSQPQQNCWFCRKALRRNATAKAAFWTNFVLMTTTTKYLRNIQ
eukprot:3844678-Rhodomonas_salina.1